MHLGVIHHHRTRSAIHGQQRNAHAHSHTHPSITAHAIRTNIHIHTSQGGSPATTTYVNLISIFISCSYRQARGVLRSPILIGLSAQNCPNRPSSSEGACGAALVKHPPFHNITHLEDPFKHRSSRPRTFTIPPHRLR